MREPTQSLQLEIPDAERESNPSLAMGTHGDERTKVESPSARNSPPSRASTKPPPVPVRDDPENRLGQTFGTYKLMELLGKGGMGYVYRAEHTKLGREVALKLLRADYARRRDAVNRFFQEAKTVNRVRHRNIVDVTDFVELGDGTTFIIMELLRGQSLGRWSRSGVDLPRALAVLVQICDGLGAAHAVGVVHRDLKPDNVIVVPTSDGAEMVKLLDFGVAKLVNRDDEDVGFETQAGSVIGTPAYMSPEQAGGMAVDQRSDIYSLGAIMYELFCGEPLFRGRSFGEFVRKHLTEMPIPPRQTQGGSNIEPALELLILRSIAKEPNDRFAHIVELRDGLLALLGGAEPNPSGLHPPSGLNRHLSTHLPSSQQMPLPAPQLTTQPTPPPYALSHISQPSYAPNGYASVTPAKSTMWPWLLGGAVAVGLGITAALFYVQRSDDTKAADVAAVQMPVVAPTPLVEPAPQLPVAPAKQVELRFDSLPSGGVYAEGHSAELCRTPCAFNIDLADGGPTDHRNFVVRSEGYLDKTIAIDLTSAQREFHVNLEHDVAPIAVDSKKRIPGKKKPGTKQVVEETKPPVDDKPPIKHDDSLEKIEHKNDPAIDPTDTHDPFKSHKK